MLLIPTTSACALRTCFRSALAMGALLAVTACSPQPAAQSPVQPAPTHADHAASAAPADAGHDTHAAQPTHAAALPPEGQRWATDAPLRAGMASIRQAVGALEHGVHGHLDAAQQQAVAKQVDAAVAGMIANCKLVPEADASLHGLLATFISGAAAARKGHFGEPELAAMQEALAQYPQRFDDPTWKQSSPE